MSDESNNDDQTWSDYVELVREQAYKDGFAHGREETKTERRWHVWHATESFPNGNTKLWRHGRWHIRIPGRGRVDRYKGGNRGRGDLGMNIEWHLLPPKSYSHGTGFELTWGTNGSETTPDLGIYAGRLGSVWLQCIHWFPYSWFERTKIDRKGERVTDYDSRVFGIRIAKEYISWKFWARKHEHRKSDPWWMYGYHNWSNLILGFADATKEEIDGGAVVIPMPEKGYPAEWRKEKYTWTYRKPLGRLRDRIFGKKTRIDYWVDVPGGIPVPGKGENSYDCDDDAVYGTGGRTLEDAVANVIRAAGRQRRQYGGIHMNLPKP